MAQTQTPKWPADHAEKHAAAARKGWQRKRAREAADDKGGPRASGKRGTGKASRTAPATRMARPARSRKQATPTIPLVRSVPALARPRGLRDYAANFTEAGRFHPDYVIRKRSREIAAAIEYAATGRKPKRPRRARGRKGGRR